MNRDCGCQHHARNISIDKFPLIKMNEEGQIHEELWPTDRIENVQNALELLAGRDLKEIAPLLEEAKKNLKNLSETYAKLLKDINNLKTVVTDIIKTNSKYTILESCPYNKKANLDNEEPLYYISPLLNLIPDVNEDGQITSDDYLALYYLKYNLDDGKLNTIKKILNEAEDLDISGKEYLKTITKKNWKDKIESLSDEEAKDFLTDYDLKLIETFIQEVKNKTLYPRDNNEPDAPLKNLEDWEFFVDFINPWMKLQWPDFNGDGEINALDASIILTISAKAGSGETNITYEEVTQFENNPKIRNAAKWIDKVDASLSAQVKQFSTQSAVGYYSNDELGWRDFILTNGVVD